MTSTESSTGMTGDQRAEIADLFHHLEAAMAPDWDLDARLWRAVTGGEYMVISHSHAVKNGGGKIPMYTASIDEALTLVPAGYDYGFSYSKQHGLETWVQKPFKGGECHQGYAPEGMSGDSTRAIALCIAGLRATVSVKDHQS